MPRRRRPRWKKFASSALVGVCGLTSITSCTFDDSEVARQHIEDVTATIEGLTPAAPTSDYAVLQVEIDRPYTGLAPLDPPAPQLPPSLIADDAVSLPLAGPTDDSSMAAVIEAATGVAVRLVGARPPDAPPGIFQAAAAALPEGGIWTGALDSLLDTWTGARGYVWSYNPDAQTIMVIRSQAVVFRLNALAGAQTTTGATSTTESAAAGGSQNLAQQTVTTTADYDPWADITAQLTSILDPSTRVAAAPATASITVTGLPQDIDRARNYLAWLNRTTLRPVTLTIAVYTVKYSNQARYEIGIAGTLENVFGTSTGLRVLSDDISVVRPGPAVDTLTATVGALETAGTVSRELTATVPSLNAQPAQFFELFSEAYLREIRTTVSDGLIQTDLIPGTVSSGFALTYLAQIVSPNEILVRLFASILDRPVFEVFSSGQHRLQLPSYGNRAVQITQRVGRGETLVITGFRDRGTTADNSGTFDADVPLPFGGEDISGALTEQVLLVRAEAGAPMGIVERQGEEL